MVRFVAPGEHAEGMVDWLGAAAVAAEVFAAAAVVVVVVVTVLEDARLHRGLV